MSYILDALKRAEQERQIGQMPNAAISPNYDEYDDEPRRWPWLLLAGLLLVSTSAALGVWFSQTGPSSAPNSAPRQAPVSGQNPPPFTAQRYPASANNNSLPTRVVAVTSSPQVIDRTPETSPASKPQADTQTQQQKAENTEQEPSVASASIDSDADEPSPPEIAAMEAIALATPTQTAKPAAKPKSAPQLQSPSLKGNPGPVVERLEPKVVHLGNQPVTDDVPLLNETDPSFRRTVPSLQLQFHRYSTDPERSFVLIDGTRYRAGQTLSAGPTLEQIVENGLLLRWQGQRFIYPAGG